MNNDDFDVERTFSELSSLYGISPAFFKKMKICNVGAGDKLSLKGVCYWLAENNDLFRTRCDLKALPPLADTLSLEESQRSLQLRALHTFADFAATLSEADAFDWPLWKKSAYAALEHSDGSLRIIPPDELTHKYKPFIPFFEDSIWCANKAEELEGEENPNGYLHVRADINRYAHLSILSSALALEAAANCALATLEPRGQTTNDIDKLSTFGKLDVFLLSRGSQVLPRGDKLAQAMIELISLRNSAVHPKIEKNKWLHKIGVAYVSQIKLLPQLGIASHRHHISWESKDAINVLRMLCSFLTDYFLGACAIKPIDMRKLLFDEGIDGEKVRHYEHQFGYIIEPAIRRWDLDIRFTCPYVGRSTSENGWHIEYEPGYPEDKEVRRWKQN